jgi:hypothetical protein
MAENPFEDVERAVAEMIQKQHDLVKQLDSMDVDVTPWEAEFLDNVLKQLEDQKKPLTEGQLNIVHRMCMDYNIDFDEDLMGK